MKNDATEIDTARLKAFMKSPDRNGWVPIRPFKVYFRKSKRIISGEMKPTLDVGNLEQKPGTMGKGYFSKLLVAIELTAIQDGRTVVFFENIFTPELISILERKGYDRDIKYEPLVCMYKIIPEESWAGLA